MSTTQAVPQAKNTAMQSELHMSFELGDKSWKLTASDGQRGPSRYSVHAGDTEAVLDCVRRTKERCRLSPQAAVRSWRDGWWLHRWLTQQGIDNVVVDAASIEVNRRARRPKTDRLDGDKLLTMHRRHHTGEHVWSVLREPTPEQEDARRAHRELARLTQERVAHMNRIRSLLVLHNLRPQVVIGGRDWANWWANHRGLVPHILCNEIERAPRRVGRGQAPTDRPTGPAARDRAQGRLGTGQGSLWLAMFRQPARGRRLSRTDANALRQRRQPDRTGHQQSR
jgi:transposase